MNHTYVRIWIGKKNNVELKNFIKITAQFRPAGLFHALSLGEMASAEEAPPSHEYECTVVVDWEGSLGLILGVNRSTGLAAVTSVVPGGPLSKRYPGLLEQHAELWSIDDVAFAAFPAHSKAELKSHAELKAYVTSMEGQADVDDAAVATMWKEMQCPLTN